MRARLMYVEASMIKGRFFRILSGVVAIGLVLAATAWVIVPDPAASSQAVAGQSGRTLNGSSAMAGLGGNPVPDAGPSPEAGPIVILPDKVDLSPPLREIPPIVPEKRDETLVRFIEPALPGRDGGSWDGVDPGLQDWQGAINMPAPSANFEGTSNVSGVLPPDTQGDVGPTHYVQWVNLAFTVYSKAGSAVYGPAAGNTIWSGFGGVCQSYNDGDPITIYDHLAGRWMMAQFVYTESAPYYMCIAVSQTGDPTGSWHRYAYPWPNSDFPDYPHFGLWPDAYYMTANLFLNASTWHGAGVAAFERDKMLTGAAAQMVYYSLYSVDSDHGGQLPADLDGQMLPPTGAPGLILEWYDSSWGIGPSDALGIWEFDVDWAVPSNSTLGTGKPGGPNYTLLTNNVDPELCIAARERCIDQPGTPRNLEAINDRLMHRVQYRNFGTHQTLVGNHTVDSNSPSAGIAGIHWFELRKTSGAWGIYQQGTYGPGDGAARWMGSIAMDGGGNIALGYSVSGASVYPSIRYVGRLAADPLGSLPQSETVLIAGGGSQTYSTYGRWGDYSAMQVDPSDDCTFWYTQEYYQTTSTSAWRTRIGAFVFPTGNCAPTSVDLRRFEAWPEGSAIHAQWETVQEIDNLGFNLYRSNTRSGPKLKLNAELIPTLVPPGSPFGAVYDWIDTYRLRPGRAYFYWLEDVDLYGNATLHGPVRVRLP